MGVKRGNFTFAVESATVTPRSSTFGSPKVDVEVQTDTMEIFSAIENDLTVEELMANKPEKEIRKYCESIFDWFEE